MKVLQYTLRALVDDNGTITEETVQITHPEVLTFAVAMEKELKENDHKGGWKNCSLGFLMKKLSEEEQELYCEIIRYKHCKPEEKEHIRKKILSEAADVGNIAMMLADVTQSMKGDE